MTLDLSTLKPNTICISRDGREWEYVGTAPNEDYPYIFYNAATGPWSFTPDGQFHKGISSDRDIISIKPEGRESPAAAEVNAAYFITCKEHLPQEQYDRLKSQIDSVWPKHLRRPILLEGCEVVKL